MLKLRINKGIAILHDVVAAALAWWLSYILLFNFDLPVEFRERMLSTLVLVVPMQSAVFLAVNPYRSIWRYASEPDLFRILLAVVTSVILIPLVLSMLRVQDIQPRSVLIIDAMLLILMMVGSRLLYRLWRETLMYGGLHLQGEPVLVLGAGEAGIMLSKELARSKDWHLVGFLDDDAIKQGRTINGIEVLGKIDSLSLWSAKLAVNKVIIAMPSVTHQERKRVIELANQQGITTLTVPVFGDLLSGRVAISQLRPVELDDLLGRDPVKLDGAGLHQQLANKVVLVTGAGGSIGSELCRQIAHFSPGKLVLYESSEFALYTIEQDMQKQFPHIDIVYLAGDVRDDMRLEQTFGKYRPSVVFHAAAYKHVPLMERNNTWQAVRNNVFGTWRVASWAQRHGVEKFVLISTDKAVNPTNVMGATKRMAEMVCQGLQQKNGTSFVIVRFGNVLGSNGSVIPKFNEQIAQGGPITVTHPEITRFFMSIPEAAQLVMQAGYMGKGGEIFVLDMGQPVKIVDLAKDLIRLSGLSEDDIKIDFIGLRPGEKLYEELLANDENTLLTTHTKLRIAQARPVNLLEVQAMLSWINSDKENTDEYVREWLQRWVPEYSLTLNQ